jgi:hypothetical protein
MHWPLTGSILSHQVQTLANYRLLISNQCKKMTL